MKIRKVLTLSFLLLALVAIVNHQLAQNSKQVLNTSLIPAAQAQGTPTPTPTPTPTSTPVIGESCTPGFYKNHTDFINGGTCVSGVTKDTLVSTVFGSFGSSCVYDKSFAAGPAGSCQRLR